MNSILKSFSLVLIVTIVVWLLIVSSDTDQDPHLSLALNNTIHDGFNISAVNSITANFSNLDNPLVNITYPANRTKAEFFFNNFYNVQFISPKESGSDKFHENVNLVVEVLQKPLTLEEYTINSTKIPNATLKAINYKLEEIKSDILANTSAFEILYSGINPDNLNIKTMEIFTIKDQIAYILTYTAEESKYDLYMPITRKMIDSFQILNNMPAANFTQWLRNNQNMTGNATIPYNSFPIHSISYYNIKYN